jgi:hypothetical protein
MEVVDGNDDNVIDGNEEQSFTEIVENDSCTVGRLMKEPYIGMKFDSQENAYSFYTHYAVCWIWDIN